MPPDQVGPEGLRALDAALGSLREVARNGADEALDHLPEVGDRDLQRALDGYLEQVADLLREVEASASDVAARLRVTSDGTLPSFSNGPSSTRDPGLHESDARGRSPR